MGTMQVGQSMSPLTKQLLISWVDFQDKTPGGIKKELLGRVFALGISCISHAEAVSRLAYILFLQAHGIFSSSNKDLLKQQKETFWMAYTTSFKSFSGFFQQTVFTKFITKLTTQEKKYSPKQEVIFEKRGLPKKKIQEIIPDDVSIFPDEKEPELFKDSFEQLDQLERETDKFNHLCNHFCQELDQILASTSTHKI